MTRYLMLLFGEVKVNELKYEDHAVEYKKRKLT